MTAQFAELVKFYYLWLRQSFSYKGGSMAGRFSRELTIRQLRALAAVQKHGSVTAAANQLHLTQPAVTLAASQSAGAGGASADPAHRRRHAADGCRTGGPRAQRAHRSGDRGLRDVAGDDRGPDRRAAFRSARSAPRNISCRLRSPRFSKLHPNIDIRLTIGNRAGDRRGAARL